MNSLGHLNALVNRALRAINDAAVCSARVEVANRKYAIEQLVQAVECVSRVKDVIVKADPTLEYHFDVERAATPYMESVATLVKEAQAARGIGDLKRTQELLKLALNLEPPPFAYESIEKQLNSLGVPDSPDPKG